MKNFHFYCFFLLNLVTINLTKAQTAVAPTCSSVTISNFTGAMATNNIYISGYTCNLYAIKGNPCSKIAGSCGPTDQEFQLVRTDVQPNVVGAWVKNFTFNNLAHGTYVINVNTPVIRATSNCPNPTVINDLGQVIGFLGRWQFSTTNEVVVGAAVTSELDWKFTSTSPFSPTAPIIMDTKGTKNYDIWWLGMFEIGGQNRVWNQGWTAGKIPKDSINLRALQVFGLSNSYAQLPVKYTVQFAIAVQQCNTIWANLNKDFAICPAFLGCRTDEDQAIVLSPNPANSTFRLSNIDMSSESQTKVMLTDISGRTVKVFEADGQQDFDISELNNGFYLVSVVNQTGKIFGTKLSILK